MTTGTAAAHTMGRVPTAGSDSEKRGQTLRSPGSREGQATGTNDRHRFCNDLWVSFTESIPVFRDENN